MAGISSRATRHGLKARGNDYYGTPPEAIAALMRIERLPRRIWDPCCGAGEIVLPLRVAGHDVVASDLVDYGCPDAESGHDFLLPFAVPEDIEGIVLNPPFKNVEAFLEKALRIAPYVACLARLAFLEGAARRFLWSWAPLARVWVSSRRLPMMHRHNWEGPRTGSAIAFAWFVFEAGHSGPPELHWFDWREGG